MNLVKKSVWVMECRNCGHSFTVTDKKLKQHYARFTFDECPKCHATLLEHSATIRKTKVLC